LLSVSPVWPSCIKLHLNLILGFTNKPRNDGGLSANHTGIMTNEGQGGQNLREGIEQWMYRGLFGAMIEGGNRSSREGRESIHRERKLFVKGGCRSSREGGCCSLSKGGDCLSRGKRPFIGGKRLFVKGRRRLFTKERRLFVQIGIHQVREGAIRRARDIKRGRGPFVKQGKRPFVEQKRRPFIEQGKRPFVKGKRRSNVEGRRRPFIECHSLSEGRDCLLSKGGHSSSKGGETVHRGREAIHHGRGGVVRQEKRLFVNVVGRKNNGFPHWEIQNST